MADFWQTYAWSPINPCNVSLTSLAALVSVYRVRKNYALCEVTSDGVDTVGVWGSNPHAPINRINNFAEGGPSWPLFCVVDCAMAVLGLELQLKQFLIHLLPNSLATRKNARAAWESVAPLR